MVWSNMVERVYIETSIIGAYLDNRSDVISAAQNQWTRIWWDDLRQNYELAISRAVIDELSIRIIPIPMKR